MREKMHGVWRRRAGTWVSITAWTIDLTQKEYETLNHHLGACPRIACSATGN
jgi:hypothetical protein